LLLMGLYMTIVLQTLWNWFAVNALHVPEIGFWAAYGLFLLVSVFRTPPKVDPNDGWPEAVGLMIGQAVGLTMALVIGFGVHLLV
jgi:hypothetical protein